MSFNFEITRPHQDFEKIKRLDENGIEYWTARDLFPLLGYSEWRSFEEVIKRAKRAAMGSGQIIENHFGQLTKMVETGSNSLREIKDWKLDRYACYLIAQNGDSKIEQIAIAQTYFAVQTRKQEINGLSEKNKKRLFIREEVSRENKKLFKTAKKSGVFNFGSFNDAGYLGLYNMRLSEIESKKFIKKGELLDRAGSLELAANLFRITQTEDRLKKGNKKSQNDAEQTHNRVGKKVRQTIIDIGGTVPENLKPETHIKEVAKEIKKLKNKL